MEEPKKPRGRPPAYDRDVALGRVGDTFWQQGYAATTLDDLSTATGMNRPSLYGAFGDKHALYLEVLTRYAGASQRRLETVLARDEPLVEQLVGLYDAAIDIYLAYAGRGCFLIGTALSEAVDDPAIRTPLRAAFERMDDAFTMRFERARAGGEIATDSDPRALAQVACAVLNALAVRARAGARREDLRRTARQAGALLAA